MLTEPHTAVSKVVVKDAYGTVTATNNTTFCCLIQFFVLMADLFREVDGKGDR